jgi:hypothetical protein
LAAGVRTSVDPSQAARLSLLFFFQRVRMMSPVHQLEAYLKDQYEHHDGTMALEGLPHLSRSSFRLV